MRFSPPRHQGTKKSRGYKIEDSAGAIRSFPLVSWCLGGSISSIHAPAAKRSDLPRRRARRFCAELAAGAGAGTVVSAEPDHLRDAREQGGAGGARAARGGGGWR